MYKSAFSCTTAAVYHHLKHVHKLDIELESVNSFKQFMALSCVNSFLVPPEPQVLIDDFLKKIDARLAFDDMVNVDQAMDFACSHLQHHGPLSANVNLRYDVLEPLSFDNDYWHFQLIIGSNTDNSFNMYDQFEDAYFIYENDRLRKAIDTQYNYRFENRFTPFLSIDIDDKKKTQELINQNADLTSELVYYCIDNYPLDQQIESAKCFVDRIMQERIKQASSELTYRSLNTLSIIAKSRKVVSDHIEKHYKEQSIADKNSQKEVKQLPEIWSHFKHVFGIALMRGTKEELERVEAQLIATINKEKDILHAQKKHLSVKAKSKEVKTWN